MQLLHGCWRLHLSFFRLQDSQDTGSCLGARCGGGSFCSDALRFIEEDEVVDDGECVA